MHVYRAKGDRLVSDGVASRDFQWGETEFHVGDTVPCPGLLHDAYPHCAVCSPSVVLKIMIRKPIEAVRFGYYQISTKSIGNYVHFQTVWDIITDGGRLDVSMNHVPFILRVTPRGTLYQNKEGMWSAKDNFFLELEIEPAVVQAKQLDGERRFMAALEGRTVDTAPQLSAPELVVEEPEGEEELEPPPWAGIDEGIETVQGEPVEDPPSEGPQLKTRSVSFTTSILNAVVKAGYAEDRPEAMALLNRSKLSRNDPEDIALRWCNHYRGAVSGGDSEADAVKYADLKTFEGLSESA
jgi:hypothetical protein